jgi:NADH-ubiquinone oxidoreductase chain 4
MFNRIGFGGTFSKFFENNISDISKREFLLLLILVLLTIIFGIYPSFILDGLHYNVGSLIYSI